MALQYSSEWRFDGIDIKIPPSGNKRFLEVIGKIAAGQSNAKLIYETVRLAFGDNNRSSNTSFAESDMTSCMRNSCDNAAHYVDSLWTAIEQLDGQFPVPSFNTINRILREEGVALRISPPHLLRTDADAVVTDDDESPAEVGQMVYRRTGKLGSGGFGVVHRVTRTTAVGDFHFAMKVFDPQPFAKNRQRALERFNREIEILSRLQHRGIIWHIEAGIDDDEKPYILMPIIDGDDLYSLTDLAPSAIVESFIDILDALEYAHANKVIHRDLKPANILIRKSDQQPIVLDFGCGYLFDDMSEKVLTTKFVGTSEYAPPEVLKNPSLHTPQQDVYAIGVLLYEILTQQRPDSDEYEPIESQLDGVVGIDKIIQAAIAPSKKRTSTAAELRDQLREL